MKKISYTKKGNQLFAPINNLLVPEWYLKPTIPEKLNLIRKSLHDKGFLDSITINTFKGREGVILNGVQTLNACLDLGLTELPVFLAYVEPDQEAEVHVLLNEQVATLNEDQKRSLMKARFMKFFDVDEVLLNSEQSDFEDNLAEEVASIVKKADEKFNSFELKPRKTIRRCVFNLPYEYRDYPEIAMKALGFKSKSLLFIELLKCCVEEAGNEAA